MADRCYLSLLSCATLPSTFFFGTKWFIVNRASMICLGSAGFMLYVIERAKKCLDFAATLYIIHLFICIVYGGWPASVTWWVVNITGLAIMALLGEYLCIRRELKEIPISRLRASKQFNPTNCLFISFVYFLSTCGLYSNLLACLFSLLLIFV